MLWMRKGGVEVRVCCAWFTLWIKGGEVEGMLCLVYPMD